MELLVGALEEAELAGKLPFVAREEGDVQRGDAEPVGDLHSGLQQQRLALARLAEARTSRRVPVTGVKGTETCSFG